MVNHLYDHGTAPGAVVNAGHHAMVFEGATTSCDPALEECRFKVPGYSITTVYVDDPWFNWSSNEPGRQLPNCTWNGQAYVCGKVGITAAIPWVTWSNYYYTPWTAQDCSYWNNKWVTVERSTMSGEPSAPVGLAQGESPILKPEWTAPSAESTPGEEWAEPTSTDILVAASTSIADLDSAFRIAKAQFGLNERREFADAIEGGHITTVRHVRSLVTTFPDYVLATVVGNRGLRGVAMFTLEAVGPTFAGMVVTPEPMVDFGSFSPVDAVNAARLAGHAARGNAELVWGWSAESRSPFEPIYAVNTDLGSTFITLAGDVRDQLHLEAPPVSGH